MSSSCCPPVAQVGNEGFQDFETAIGMSFEPGTLVTLLRDTDRSLVAFESDTRDIVFDLNGRKIMGGGQYSGPDAIHVLNGSKLTIKGDGEVGASSAEAALHVDDGGEVIIQGGTFLGTLNVETGGKLTVTGGTFTVNPKEYVPEGYTLTIAEGQYTVSKEDDGYYSLLPVESVTDAAGTTTVSASVSPADVLPDRDLVVRADEGDGIEVSFNVPATEDLIEKAGDKNIDVKVTTGKAAAAANEKAYAAAVAGKKDGALVVDLAMTAGGQPIFSETAENGCAFVSIPFAVGEKETLAVYYLNGDKAEELKFVAADKIAEADAGSFTYSDGCVLLKLAHFSQYLLTLQGDGSGSTPKTFDAGIAAYGVGALLSAAGAAWLGLRKKTNYAGKRVEK